MNESNTFAIVREIFEDFMKIRPDLTPDEITEFLLSLPKDALIKHKEVTT